eukprot:GGOE01001299.1.p1 GENE.GGOE01001299.1~~GGOE01001299.1.p1  ORF type:complete len:742 (+),score=157.12 GGOE01001299.1:31-2226(+)
MGASDSKYLFRHRVNQLICRPVQPDDHEFWKLLYISQLTTEEVFSLVQPCDVRRLRQKQPINLAFLVFKSIEQLLIFASNELQDFTSASNSIKILARVVPFVFENGRFDSEPLDEVSSSAPLLMDDEVEVGPPQPSEPLPDGYDFVENFFWANRILGPENQDLVFTTIGGKPLDRPLGTLLMQLLLHTCFYPRFTRPVAKTNSGNVAVHGYPHLMPLGAWCGGVGISDAHVPPSTAMHDANRVDVLRCILACCTQTVFEKDPLCVNKFAGCITSLLAPPSVTLCYSLLNVIGSYNPKGSLPYSSYLGVSRETLLEASLHLLLTLLDYGPHLQQPPSPSATDEVTDPRDRHAFWSVLHQLSKEDDLRFLFNALTRLLSNHLEAASTLLPLSQKQINCHAELLLLLWKLIEANETFRILMCKKFDICSLVRALLWFVFETQADQSQFGTLQVVTLIVLSLSAERDFAVSLNTPFTEKVPMHLPHFTGSHADLVVLVAHQFLTLHHPWAKPLLEHWLTIVCNLSPYIKALSSAAASKLIHLFGAFTGPKHLQPEDLRSVGHVVFLVDTFNNLIQYQYEGNAYLIYMMVREQDLFLHFAQMLQEKEGEAGPPKLPREAREMLHMGTIVRMLKAVNDELNLLKVDNETELLSFIQRTTLVGLLPIPHPILIRRFEMQPETRKWLTSWQWGVICLRAANPPLLDNGAVRLARMQNAGKGAVKSENSSNPDVTTTNAP